MGTVRWGFCGTGRITRRVMRDFGRVEGGVLGAVCSASEQRARQWAAEYGAPRWFTSPEEMAQSGEVDAVYVATLHPAHPESARPFLQAGIPVLCEKPMAVNAAEARGMAALARRQGTFLMEAMWTRFFPVAAKAKQWVQEGRIGRVGAVSAQFASASHPAPGDRVLDPQKAGGALLDIGVYPINLAGFFIGERPVEHRVLSRPHPDTGVDQSDAVLLGYPGGALASLLCSFAFAGEDRLNILGEEGTIVLEAPFWRPKKARLVRGESIESIEDATPGEGFQHEFMHLQRCVAQGLCESPVMTLEETVDLLATLDEIQRGWQVVISR